VKRISIGIAMVVLLCVSVLSMATAQRIPRSIRLQKEERINFTIPAGTDYEIVPNNQCSTGGQLMSGNSNYRWCLTNKSPQHLAVTAA
jgi:hypothetical protein